MQSKKPLTKPLKIALFDGEVVCLGEGAVNFSMTVEAASLTAAALAEAVEAAQRGLAAGAGAAILLVEDEPIIRIQVAEVLSDAGYTVIEAGDAAEALAELEHGGDIQLMFTDVQMPGRLDGLGLAHLVARRWPMVFLMVASGHKEIGEDALPLGGRFLKKPYAFGEVLRHVRELTAG